jgi:hypothetical protein
MITLDGLAELGKQLARCLLPGEALRQMFLAAYRQAGDKAGVRLRLMIGDHALKQLPWEYTYLNLLDGPDSMRGFLLLDPTASIRHTPLPLPHPVISPAAEYSDLRMLIAASPQGSPT